jgi:hypothetical protein
MLRTGSRAKSEEPEVGHQVSAVGPSRPWFRMNPSLNIQLHLRGICPIILGPTDWPSSLRIRGKNRHVDLGVDLAGKWTK